MWYFWLRPSVKSVSYMWDSIAKEKSGIKKCLEICAIRRLMAKAILIFHFDYLNPSLTHILWLEILIFLGAIHLVSKRYLCVLWCCSNNFHSYSHSFCTQSWWLSYIKKCRIDQIKSIKKKSSNKNIAKGTTDPRVEFILPK